MITHTRLLIIGNQYTFRESLFNTRVMGSDFKKLKDEFVLKVVQTISRYSKENHDVITPAMTSLQAEIEDLKAHTTLPTEEGLYKIEKNGHWKPLDHTGTGIPV